MKKTLECSFWILFLITVSSSHLISKEHNETINTDCSHLDRICEKPGLDLRDHHAIHQIIERMSEAWNEHHGYGFADDYALDASFVNIFGMVLLGKEEIETRHINILATFLKGSRFEAIDVQLRAIKPGVVIVHVFWEVTNIQNPEKELLGGTLRGIFTHVLVKNNDKWEIAASQNTLTTQLQKNS